MMEFAIVAQETVERRVVYWLKAADMSDAKAKYDGRDYEECSVKEERIVSAEVIEGPVPLGEEDA